MDNSESDKLIDFNKIYLERLLSEYVYFDLVTKLKAELDTAALDSLKDIDLEEPSE